MTSHDDEFDEFLRRRRPVFGRTADDVFEPPAELDRIVLRQAREAIETERPQRMLQAPRWGAPLAVAATLMLALTVVFNMLPGRKTMAPVASDVTVSQTARELDAPAPPAAAPAAPASDETVVVDLAPMLAKERPANADESRARNAGEPMVAATPPPAAPAAADSEAAAPKAEARAELANAVARSGRPIDMARSAGAASGASVPDWRRDENAWLAHIQSLREAGDIAGADAEAAEFKRQHRAYSVAPDR